MWGSACPCPVGSDPVMGTSWTSSAKGLQPSLCTEAVLGPAVPAEHPATPAPRA